MGLGRLIRLDNWKNYFTGMGDVKRDKLGAAEIKYDRMPPKEAEILYAADDMASDIVDGPVDDALRKHFDLNSADLKQEQIEALNKRFENLGLIQKFKLAAKWGRIYGGAALLFNIEDGQEPDQELKLGNIRKIRSVTVVTRDELNPAEIEDDDRNDNFNMPRIYNYQPQHTMGSGSKRVHASRIIRFDGAMLPRELFIANSYWNDTVFSKTKEAITGYAVVHNALPNILAKFNQSIFKMKGLTETIKNQETYNDFKVRIDAATYSLSALGAIALDADEEDFINRSIALTGVSDAVDRVNGRICAAANMPHTKLLGTGPKGGIGSKGESEMNDYNDRLEVLQTDEYVPRLTTILRLIMLEADSATKGSEPAKWSITFPPMQNMNGIQESQVRKQMSETDAKYIENGVLTPDEVTKSRFGGKRYSLETEVDLKSRELPLGTEIDEGLGDDE